MNVTVLQNKLIEKPELIIKVLEELGFTNIRDRGKYIQFPNKDGDNLSGCSILKSTLQYQNFSHGGKGNLFTLVSSELDLDFPKTLKWIAKTIGLSNAEINKKIKLPFGGFYKEVKKSMTEPEQTMPVLNENDYCDVFGRFNMLWYNQGVNFETQEKFNLGFDVISNSILIPAYNYNGEFVGCKARKNDKDCPLDERWWMFLPFQKTLTLYGYHFNYKAIIEKDLVVIVEAEKSVLQLDSMNCHVGLAVMGHDISRTQEKYIKALKTKRIILAFDEGLEREEIEKQAKKLMMDNMLCSNKVGYIYDEHNKYLKKGSKDSPTDNGETIFKKLLKECVTWMR